MVTENLDEDAPSSHDDTSDSGYGTLVPDSPRGSHFALSRLRPRALRRDPRLSFSTMDLRDVPLRPQPLDSQSPQHRSFPELPEDDLLPRGGGSLPRGLVPSWAEDEFDTAGTTTGNVVVETLHRARLRSQLPTSPSYTDSAGESPWEMSGEEEEEEGQPLFPRPLHTEEVLREIREELARQRIDGLPEPRDSRPRKLTRAQLYRMRGPRVIQLDTPLSTS